MQIADLTLLDKNSKIDDSQLMGERWNLSIERPKALAAPHETALLRKALRKNPTSYAIRERLAAHLLIADNFDEVIALFESFREEQLSVEALGLLVQAHLSREKTADTARAVELAQIAAKLANAPEERAYFLAELGKAQLRIGETVSARVALADALSVNPEDRNAFKRLATLHLREGEFAELIALTDTMLGSGIAHSRLLAARVLAFAKLGDPSAALNASGFEAFFHREALEPPVGWQDLKSFNAALSQELMDHPSLRYDRYGTASTKTWRIDEPAAGGSNLLLSLQESIVAAVNKYVQGLAGQDHPWVRRRPENGILHNWCVITDGDGHEEWHVHQNGWLSGVYYVAVPDRIAGSADSAGCIAFGLPEDLAGSEAAAAFGTQVQRPAVGTLMMFPSHCYHRTFAHGDHGRRICLAFDIWPG